MNQRTRPLTHTGALTHTDALSINYPLRAHAHTRAREGDNIGKVRQCASVRQSASGIAEDLETLAARLRQLVPSHRDPEAFHVAKSDLVDALRRLAARERGA